VELDNTVEGMVRLSDMTDDYYHFHEQHMVLIGERTARVFRIGDEVRVRVARVNMDEHTVEFELVDMKPRRADKISLVDERGRRGGGKQRGKSAGKAKKAGKHGQVKASAVGRSGSGKKRGGGKKRR